MDPYSAAKRHALYQPRGPTEYDLDFSTISGSKMIPQLQQQQQLGESHNNWYDHPVGVEGSETTAERRDGNILFRPATQSAKRIRVESDEILIPLDVRSEVFALLSGANLDEFLEIRQFLKRPSQTATVRHSFDAVTTTPGIYSTETTASVRAGSNSRSASMPAQRSHWQNNRQPSQIGMDSNIFGARHDSISSSTYYNTPHISKVQDPNVPVAGVNYISEEPTLQCMDGIPPNMVSGMPTLTSHGISYLDDHTGTGTARDFSRRRGIYVEGTADPSRDSTISRSSISSIYTDRSLSSKHSSTSTLASQNGCPFNIPPMPTLSSAAIQSMAQFVDLKPPLTTRSSPQSTPQIPCNFPPCKETFGRKADRDRHHSQFHLPETLFTCLLDICTSACENPCAEKFHKSPCRKTRADKMKGHLASSHGIDIKQSEIPESWRRFYLHSSNGWTCGFCNEFLGTWTENEAVINGHFESCKLPEAQATSKVEQKLESIREPEAGNELNNSLKRLSVQEKPNHNADEILGSHLRG